MESGYEEARRATVWNARTPPRHPDLIVQAASERDLVAAVRLARSEGMRIGVRSGGHSWAGNHVRDGGMLVHARIAFFPPSAIGFSTDALDDPNAATVVCGFVGDDRLRLPFRHGARLPRR